MIHGGNYVSRTIEVRRWAEENTFTTEDLSAGCWHLTAHDGDCMFLKTESESFDLQKSGVIVSDGDTVEIHVDGRDPKIVYWLTGGYVFLRKIGFVEISEDAGLLLPTVTP